MGPSAISESLGCALVGQSRNSESIVLEFLKFSFRRLDQLDVIPEAFGTRVADATSILTTKPERLQRIDGALHSQAWTIHDMQVNLRGRYILVS